PAPPLLWLRSLLALASCARWLREVQYISHRVPLTDLSMSPQGYAVSLSAPSPQRRTSRHQALQTRFELPAAALRRLCLVAASTAVSVHRLGSPLGARSTAAINAASTRRRPRRRPRRDKLEDLLPHVRASARRTQM